MAGELKIAQHLTTFDEEMVLSGDLLRFG